MDLKLILSDSTQIILSSGDYINSFTTLCKTREQINFLWTKLSPENTNRVKIVLGDNVIQVIENIHINGVQVREDPNSNTYIVTFNFYGASYARDIDQEYTNAARILLGEDE